jgi:uncharacterized coiled-coil protein SlyX
MRRIVVALTALLVLSLGFGPEAEAKCSVSCLNHRVMQLSNGLTRAEKKIASLKQTVSQQGQTISSQQQALAALGEVGKKVDALYACLFEVPVTQFGAPEDEGYLYENATETFKTTALDVPYEGEPISFWTLIDGCNTTATAGVDARSALAPTANLRTLLQPQRRLFP